MVSEDAIPSGKLLLAICAAYLFLLIGTISELHGIWPDEALYMGATKNMLAGRGLVLGGESGIFPGLPILSSLFILLFGGFSKTPFYAATALAGLVAVIFTYLLGRKATGSGLAGLAAAVLLATNHVFFFYSSRILLDVYDAAVCAAGLFAILCFIEHPSRRNALVSGAIIALGYFVRIPNLVALAAAFAAASAYLLASRKMPLSQLAGKAALAFAAAAIPVLAYAALTRASIIGIYSSVASGALATAMSNFPNLATSLQFILNGWPLLLLALAGFAMLAYSRPEHAPALAAFAVSAAMVRIGGYPYDARYLLSILPVLAASLAFIPVFATERIRHLKGNAYVRAGLAAVLTLAIALPSLNLSYAMFSSKKGGYVEIEQAADWLRKNTAGDEAVFAGSYRIVGIFSDRRTLPLPATEDELRTSLANGTARYVEIDNYEWNQPGYALGLPANMTAVQQFVNQATGAGAVILALPGR